MYVSGQKRGVTAALNAGSSDAVRLPYIGHMKSDGLLGRCHLKGLTGMQYAVLCGADHNLRQLLYRLRAFCVC